MVTKTSIDNFLSKKEMALAGVSRNKKKFGNQVYVALKDKGFNIVPINPNTEDIAGTKCYPDVASIPEGTDRLLIMTPKDATSKLVDEAIKKGIKHIWIQQDSDTTEAVKMARDADVNLIHKKCIMMFAEPVKGIHGVHRWFAKLFGTLPK